jgi:thioesterase domain-containing protein
MEIGWDAIVDDGLSWPLPAAFRQGLAAALAQWPGERRSAQATITGHNIDGDLPPIFWVFNVPKEAGSLSQALGRRQPLYAMRSGYQLIDYREDEIQAFALRYVSEIEQLCPAGPLFVAGNCQGCIIALAIAQHLLRRKRHIPLLVLLDWSFELQPYRGRVLLMAGTDNVNLNPRRLYARPELAWARAFAHHAFAEITGGFAEAFDAGHIDYLVRTLRQKMQEAMLEPPNMMPESGYRVALRAGNLPTQADVRQRFSVKVLVKNDSKIVWAASDRSGIVLSSRWVPPDSDQPPQPTASIPSLSPLEIVTVDLEIVAPDKAGAFTLVLDLLEEGNRWFHTSTADALCSQSQVVVKDTIWKRLSKRFGLM